MWQHGLCCLWGHCRPLFFERQQPALPSAQRGFSRPLTCFLSIFSSFEETISKEKGNRIIFHCDFWNYFANVRRRRASYPCCLPPRSQRLWSDSSFGSLLGEIAKSFSGLRSVKLWITPEEGWSGTSSGDDSWCQCGWGGWLWSGPRQPFWARALPTSDSRELAFVLHGKNINPHLSFITSFRGLISLNVIQTNKN